LAARPFVVIHQHPTMPFFPDAQNTNVHDSNLVDVRGDFHYYANQPPETRAEYSVLISILIDIILYRSKQTISRTHQLDIYNQFQ
jgi:hypothetical protein